MIDRHTAKKMLQSYLFLYFSKSEQETPNSQKKLTFFSFLFPLVLQQSNMRAAGLDSFSHTGSFQPILPSASLLSLWLSIGLHNRGLMGHIIIYNKIFTKLGFRHTIMYLS